MGKNKQVVLLPVKVITKAKNNRIVGWQGGFLKIQLTVTPTKGKANDKLIDLLANFLNITKSELTIVRGHTIDKKYINLPIKALEKLKINF